MATPQTAPTKGAEGSEIFAAFLASLSNGPEGTNNEEQKPASPTKNGSGPTGQPENKEETTNVPVKDEKAISSPRSLKTSQESISLPNGKNLSPVHSPNIKSMAGNQQPHGEDHDDETDQDEEEDEHMEEEDDDMIMGEAESNGGEKRKRAGDDEWKPGKSLTKQSRRPGAPKRTTPGNKKQAPGSPTPLLANPFPNGPSIPTLNLQQNISPVSSPKGIRKSQTDLYQSNSNYYTTSPVNSAVSSPRTMFSPGDERMSFQEAAVQVLTEQREKGIHALSTRRIWELISQAGLVDTKCKTPVSSLSSRITEDVRTKGNKSVFLRVGEGLYTLRKGLKKQELERFLQTKYPNMNLNTSDVEEDFHSPSSRHEEDQFDEEDDNGSHMRSLPSGRGGSIKRGRGRPGNNSSTRHIAQPQQSLPPSKKLQSTKPNGLNSSTGALPTPQVQPHHHHSLRSSGTESPFLGTRSASSSNLALISSWVGLPLRRKSNGKVYYTAVKVDKQVYRIGDCAYFNPPSEEQLPFIGVITKLWQGTGSKISPSPTTSGNIPQNQMFVQCTWYYYPEDTKHGRNTKKHHKNELFLTDISDVNPVDNLLSTVEVLSFPEYNKRVNSSSYHHSPSHPSATSTTPKKDSELFFCRLYYDDQSGVFHSFMIDYDTGKVTIEGINKDHKNPLNWPHVADSAEYTNKLIWNVADGVKEMLLDKIPSNVHLRAIEPSDRKSPLAVYASTDVKEGNTIGYFTGYVVRTTQQASFAVPLVRPLYDDKEVSLLVDATTAGNEFRFLRNVSDIKTENKISVNARFSPVFLNGIYNLLVLATRNISKDEEIVVDFSEQYITLHPKEELTAEETTQHTPQLKTRVQNNKQPIKQQNGAEDEEMEDEEKFDQR